MAKAGKIQLSGKQQSWGDPSSSFWLLLLSNPALLLRHPSPSAPLLGVGTMQAGCASRQIGWGPRWGTASTKGTGRWGWNHGMESQDHDNTGAQDRAVICSPHIPVTGAGSVGRSVLEADHGSAPGQALSMPYDPGLNPACPSRPQTPLPAHPGPYLTHLATHPAIGQ